MSLENGTVLGHFEILAPIGAGGMGEVYKARDTRLERTVAIKVLPEHLAESPERKQRFEREAKAISRLNHPHICTLYDVGRDDDVDYLVMEYIDGDTLAARLEKGALPLELALEYGVQIADGLDNAHRAGIVHRDLKPPNIIITKSGVKLLDFGLARVIQEGPGQEAPGSEGSDAPTQQRDLTKEHSILGTLQYMAPEQLEAKSVDARTDIWAFGAILYEMVTGRKAFEGESQASLITAIMSAAPPVVSSLQPLTPSLLDRVIRTCLAKDPDDRWGTAGDVGRQLSWVTERDPSAEARSALTRSGRAGWAAALAVVLLGAAAWVVNGTRPGPVSRITRLAVDLPPDHRIANGFHPIALSPDGNLLVYAATAGQGDDSQLFARSLDEFESVRVPDTAGASEPFFAPDGVRVGYLIGDGLRWVSLDTEAAGAIADGIETLRGASWGSDDAIVFSDLSKGLLRVSASGGDVQVLTAPDDQGFHRFPRVILSGERVLFTVGFGEAQTLAVLITETGEWHTLGTEGAGAAYLPTGHIVYGVEAAVRVVPFDVDRLSTVGDPVPVLRNVYTVRGFNQPYFSVSAEGSIAYVTGADEAELVWVDRAGEISAFEPRFNNPMLPRLSPDGMRLATTTASPGGGASLWITDLARRTRTRMMDEGNSYHTLWSPDGARVHFLSDESGSWQVVEKSSDGSGSPTRFAVFGMPTSWSPDGSVALTVVGAESWVIPPDGEPKPMWSEKERQLNPTFSPDGRWVAYVSDASGRHEVYARAYPEGDRTVILSNNGGQEPLWSRDGRELYYRNGDRMMVIPITLSPTFEADAPEVLFIGDYQPFSGGPRGAPNYDVSLDGQRFLMVRRVASSVPRRIHVVRNWSQELTRELR